MLPACRPALQLGDFEPFWAAAQDLDMPVSLHAITGMERIPWETAAETRHAPDGYPARNREILQHPILCRAETLPMPEDCLGRE